MGYYPKQQYNVFQKLERSHGPHAVRLVPEYGADDGAEVDDEEAFSAEIILHQKEQEQDVEDGGEQSIEEITWEQEPAQLHVMLEHADFDLTHQNVVSAHFLLLHQAQFT